jgi:hypothetical protein
MPRPAQGLLRRRSRKSRKPQKAGGLGLGYLKKNNRKRAAISLIATATASV